MTERAPAPDGAPGSPPADATPKDAPELGDIVHAALRGAIAAMAMTGMRTLTQSVGIVEESPPQAIFRQRARGLLKPVPRRYRRGTIEIAHWAYGAAGGAVFGALPEAIRRRRRWVGPIYGLAIWGGFELAVSPALGLSQAKERRIAERLAFAADHLLYGLILSEIRARPQR